MFTAWRQFTQRLYIPTVAKFEVLLYAIVAVIHLKYVLFVGLPLHGVWSWHVLKSILYVAVSAYMIRFCLRFLKETATTP